MGKDRRAIGTALLFDPRQVGIADDPVRRCNAYGIGHAAFGGRDVVIHELTEIGKGRRQRDRQGGGWNHGQTGGDLELFQPTQGFRLIRAGKAACGGMRGQIGKEIAVARKAHPACHGGSAAIRARLQIMRALDQGHERTSLNTVQENRGSRPGAACGSGQSLPGPASHTGRGQARAGFPKDRRAGSG